MWGACNFLKKYNVGIVYWPGTNRMIVDDIEKKSKTKVGGAESKHMRDSPSVQFHRSNFPSKKKVNGNQ